MDPVNRLPHHVVIFPLPLQGPINSMFKLAELLLLSGLHVTFILTEYIYTRLVQTTNIETEMKRYPGFQLKCMPDGLSPEQSSAGGNKFMEIFDTLKLTVEPIFQNMLTSRSLGAVTCIIADGAWGFPCDVGKEIGVPVFAVRTISPCCLWAFFCLPELIEAGELPFQGDDLDVMIKSVPGTEGFLRRRDLPSFYRVPNLDHIYIDLVRIERKENPRADGLILNSFDELEESILPHMRTICPNIYTLGPLHAHLKKKMAETTTTTLSPASTSSLWEEDLSCLDWLNKQPSKSVLYVSFGSVATLTKDKLLEFWHGIVDSEISFLWVMRPDSIAGLENEIPETLKEKTKERGHIVKWAPQEKVLENEAIGGFLTHCGWNSTLESICAGVPMICWPFFGDQQVNSRFVTELWKLGLDMKDSCDRNVVVKLVRELMVERKEEFLQRAAAMAESAARCLSEGGSSYKNLERLIMDMDRMSVERS